MASPEQKNLLIRVAVAAVGIPLLLFLSILGRIPFLILVLVAACLGMLEFSRIGLGNQIPIPKYILAILLITAIILTYLGQTDLLTILFLATFLVLALFSLGLPVENASKFMAWASFGFIYLYLFSFWILIRQLPNNKGVDYALGGYWMVSLFLTVWSCDTAAYFGGKGLGRHKLAPAISPGKTKEGALFGILGALLAAVIIHFIFLSALDLFDLLMVALLVGILGQLGDLFESMLKRSAGLKDTSAIIPGHGGVLDRFDSLLFVGPWVYFYLKWFVY